MATWLVNIALMCGSVYVALLIVNAFLFDIYNFAIFDLRSRYEVVEQLNADGEEVYPITPPSSLIETSSQGFGQEQIIPMAGVSKVKIIYCNENGYTSHYFSDRYGFNNPDSVWNEAQQDVVLIGDSFAQGGCVLSDEDVAANMRNSGLKVINLGTGGHGPLLELATLAEYGSDFNAKTVVWVYYEGNDLSFLQQELKFHYLPQYLEPGFSRRLKSKQAIIDEGWKNKITVAQEAQQKKQVQSDPIWSDYLKLSNFTLLFEKLKRSKDAMQKRDQIWQKNIKETDKVEDLMTHLESKSQDSIPLFGQVISRAKQLANDQGAKFYFVYIPAYERYSYTISSFEKEVVEMVESLDIEVINFSDYMDKQPDPKSLFPYGQRGHFTPDTYQVLAEYIERSLQLD